MGGMDFKWTITNGNTGALTRELDGEMYRVVDPGKRESPQIERRLRQMYGFELN